MTTSRTGPMNIRDADQQGFTLVELLLVLAILSIMAGLSTPRFRSTHHAWAVEEDVRTLAAELTRARVDAIRRGTRIRVSLGTGAPVHYEIREDRAPAPPDPTDFRSHRDPLGEASSITTMRAHEFRSSAALLPSVHEIVFRPNGTSTGALLHVRSREPDRQYTLQVDPVLGSTRVLEGTHP